MSTPSTRCECSNTKERGADACPRCMEWDARRTGTGARKEGVRRALRNYLKEKGLES